MLLPNIIPSVVPHLRVVVLPHSSTVDQRTNECNGNPAARANVALILRRYVQKHYVSPIVPRKTLVFVAMEMRKRCVVDVVAKIVSWVVGYSQVTILPHVV